LTHFISLKSNKLRI